jgi:hypothetical protein
MQVPCARTAGWSESVRRSPRFLARQFFEQLVPTWNADYAEMADSRGVSSALLRLIRVLPRPKTQFLLRNPQNHSDLTSAPIGANIQSTRGGCLAS